MTSRKQLLIVGLVILLIISAGSFFFLRIFEPIVSTHVLTGICSQPGLPSWKIQSYRGVFHREYFFVTSPVSGTYFIYFQEKVVGKAAAGYHEDWLIPCFDKTGFYTWLETPLWEFKFSEPWKVQFSGNTVKFNSQSLSCEVTRIGS